MTNSNTIYDSDINKIAEAIKSVSSINDSENLIKSIILNTIDKYSTSIYAGKDVKKKPVLKFTKNDIEKMPKTFKKEFLVNGCTAHIYRRKFGKNAYAYDIKYRRNGYNIIVSNKNLEIAKQRFITKLQTAEPTVKHFDKLHKIPLTFNSFSMYYFETFRKKKVTAATYKSDMNRYNKYLKPYFQEKLISKITPYDCQTLFDELIDDGKLKTLNELYSILSIIFKTAILHGILKNNPLNIIVIPRHNSKHGIALTKEEEKTLLNHFQNTPLQQNYALLLYCGLRPNELKTASIQGEFIVAVNSKRKHNTVEYKKIPISPMLRPYLQGGLNLLPDRMLREQIKKALPNHILYDLRTTFYTRLKECNVSDNAIHEFVGHSLGILGNTYTDLSDEYLLKEVKKYVY